MKFPECSSCVRNSNEYEYICSLCNIQPNGPAGMYIEVGTKVSDKGVKLSDKGPKLSEEKPREFYVINGGAFRTGPDSYKSIEQLYTPHEYEQAKEINDEIHVLFHLIEYSAFEKLQSENTMLQSIAREQATKIAELEKELK